MSQILGQGIGSTGYGLMGMFTRSDHSIGIY
jgi:hypothetical protein